MILDEGHKIKNPSNKCSKGVHTVPARNRILLTGTPIQNNLKVTSFFPPNKIQVLIMSTPLGGGYIVFAFCAVRCPASRMVSAHLKEKY